MYGGEGLRLSVTTIPSSFYVKVHSGSDSNLVFARVSWTKTRQIISIKRRTLSKILCYEYLCNDPGLIEIEIFYNGEVMTRRSVRVLSRNVVVIRTSLRDRTVYKEPSLDSSMSWSKMGIFLIGGDRSMVRDAIGCS